jgi:hypothetical protein
MHRTELFIALLISDHLGKFLHESILIVGCKARAETIYYFTDLFQQCRFMLLYLIQLRKSGVVWVPQLLPRKIADRLPAVKKPPPPHVNVRIGPLEMRSHFEMISSTTAKAGDAYAP